VNTLKLHKIITIAFAGIMAASNVFAAAQSSYTTKSSPVSGDKALITDSEDANKTKQATIGSMKSALGLGTSDNPSFNSVHASGGNLAAANKQVTKAWQSGLSYTAGETSVIHGGQHYICTSTHTAGASTEPGVGASWETVWSLSSGAGDNLGSATYSNVVALWASGACSGYLKNDGSCDTPSGSATYPGSSGVANWSGSAWGTSYTVGTGANNLVQLNGSSQLPAVSAALLTNFPTLNQNTTGSAATLTTARTIGGTSFNGSANIDISYPNLTNKPTLGTAAALNVGTGANQIIQLNSSGQLPFTIDVSDLTDTDGLFTSKANASCFASESAFNACFDLTWASGGISHATSDGNYYASRNGAWTNLSGVYQPADGDLTTAAGAGTAGNSKYFGTNSGGTVGFYDVPSGSGTVTVQADDPTSASAVGWYAATGSGDIFYKSSAGLFTIAGSYVADPVTPTLSSRTIGTNGTTLTLTGSASLSFGAGGNGGVDVDCVAAGSNITATYASGAPGTDLVYTLGTTVNSGDTCDLDYTQPGNGIEATTGGADLASITSGAITNNSTQSHVNGVTLGTTGETAADSFNVSNGNNTGIRQSLVAGSSGSINRVCVYLDSTGASNNYNVAVYSEDGNTLLRDGALTSGSGLTNGTYNCFPLDSALSITSGTTYQLVFGGADDSYFVIRTVYGTPYGYNNASMTVGATMPSTISGGATEGGERAMIYADYQ